MVDRKTRVAELRKRVAPNEVSDTDGTNTDTDIDTDTDTDADEERARRFVWEPGDIEVISPPVNKEDDEER